MTAAQQILDKIRISPTAFHVAAALREDLLGHGFTELRESERWNLLPGGKYFVTRNDSAILSFVLPKEKPSAFSLVWFSLRSMSAVQPAMRCCRREILPGSSVEI